jgi:hypothetical protein
VVEGGGLENRYGSLAHREFESLPLRQFGCVAISVIRPMARPVVRAGAAGAVLCALMGLCVVAIPRLLPSWHVAWLVKPLFGIEVRPFNAEYLGLGTGADLVVSVALGGIGAVAVAFYLDHCVIQQARWAVIGGWGLLIGGLLTTSFQEVVNPSRTAFIDVDHLLWPLASVPLVIGAGVTLASWWRAPESFSPHVSRWTVLALVPAAAIVAFAIEKGVAQTAILALMVVIVSTALTAGEWIAGRSSAPSGGEPDPA